MQKHAVVIGAGVAGLATAARLAAKGYRVSVYERNGVPGGKLGKLSRAGYTWDTGPSLFTQPYLLEQLFADCGKQLSSYLRYESLPVNAEYFYADGTTFTAYKNRLQLGNEIEAKLGMYPDPVFRFLDEVQDAYRDIGVIFLSKPIHKVSTWVSRSVLVALQSLKRGYLLSTMHQYHTRCLQHPKLVQLFDRFATYTGSNPYKAPAMLCMIAHLEMNEGAYYPRGGMISIANALHALCKDLGVTFHFDTPADKIPNTGKQVTGIEVAGLAIPADIVVSNSDVYHTYKHLLGNEPIAAKIKLRERSSSAVIFYWGIKTTFKSLGLHNIFFAEDYKAEFNAIFNTHQLYDDPTVYVNITAKMEGGHAPPGCENWFVLVNTPDARYVTDDMVATVRENVLNKLSTLLDEDIADYIATEAVLTPALIAQQTGSYLGALYGTASNNKLAAFLRHSNVSSTYKNLFFAGGTVHPGGGIPLCLRSARLVSEEVG